MRVHHLGRIVEFRPKHSGPKLAVSIELPLGATSVEAVAAGIGSQSALSTFDSPPGAAAISVEISNEGVAVARVSWSGEREGWVRCAHLAKSEALEILAESSKED